MQTLFILFLTALSSAILLWASSLYIESTPYSNSRIYRAAQLMENIGPILCLCIVLQIVGGCAITFGMIQDGIDPANRGPVIACALAGLILCFAIFAEANAALAKRADVYNPRDNNGRERLEARRSLASLATSLMTLTVMFCYFV